MRHAIALLRSAAGRSLAVVAVAAGLLLAPSALVAQEVQEDPGCFLARGTLEEAATRPSPLDSASVTLGDAGAKVCYGSPRANERRIMGELVPYAQLWRTGANEATALHLEFPAEVAGIEVAPGSYSLYTLPGDGEWRVYLSTDFERWGVPISESVQAAQVGEATVPAMETDEHVENMTFSFEKESEEAATLVLEWEKTRVEIPVRRRGM